MDTLYSHLGPYLALQLRIYLELICHDLEGQACKRLSIIWLPAQRLLWVVHSCALHQATMLVKLPMDAQIGRSGAALSTIKLLQQVLHRCSLHHMQLMMLWSRRGGSI